MENAGDPAEGKIHGHVVMNEADVESGMGEGAGAMKPAMLLVPVGATVFLVLVLQRNGAGGAGGTLVAWVVVLPILWMLQRRGRKQAARRLLEGKTPEDMALTVELDSEGYSMVSPSSSSRAAWSTLHRYDEGETSFLFYPNPTFKVIIPKRAFRDEDLDRVRALLNAHVARRPLVRAGAYRTLILWVVLVVTFLAVWQLIGPPEGARPDETESGEEP